MSDDPTPGNDGRASSPDEDDEWGSGEVPDVDGSDATEAGAATGDGAPRRSRPDPEADDDPDMGDLFDELEELENLVDTPEEREQVRDAMRMAMEVDEPGVFGRVMSGFDASDAAESLLGSLLFGIPMFVEGGTQEVGTFIASNPVYLVVTLGFAIALDVGILYVADIQDVRVFNPIFGIIPRKLVGVVSIAFLTALIMMTVWGRVDWAEPWLAFCQISVAFVPMAIGAALGDLLPG